LNLALEDTSKSNHFSKEIVRFADCLRIFNSHLRQPHECNSSWIKKLNAHFSSLSQCTNAGPFIFLVASVNRIARRFWKQCSRTLQVPWSNFDFPFFSCYIRKNHRSSTETETCTLLRTSSLKWINEELMFSTGMTRKVPTKKID